MKEETDNFTSATIARGVPENGRCQMGAAFATQRLSSSTK